MSTGVKKYPPPNTDDQRERKRWENNIYSLLGEHADLTNVKFIVQSATDLLSNEQALSSLATGYMKVTTSTGVITSQAVPIPVADGGTGYSAYTLGDTLYASAIATLSKLAGNTSASKRFKTQTGTGVISAAPVWGTIADGDLPSSIVRSSVTISTTSPLSGGGDLSTNRTFSLAGLTTLGTANYVVGVASGATGWEYKQITGGANQITVTHSAGGIALTFPNTINVTTGYSIGGTSCLTGQAAHEADASASHSVTGSDSVDLATLEGALNALGTKINNILAKLEGISLFANA